MSGIWFADKEHSRKFNNLQLHSRQKSLHFRSPSAIDQSSSITRTVHVIIKPSDKLMLRNTIIRSRQVDQILNSLGSGTKTLFYAFLQLLRL